MKKKLFLILIICLGIIITGCEKNQEADFFEDGNRLPEAYSLIESGRYQEAKEIFSQYMDRDSLQESVLNGYGICCERLGETEEALNIYTQLLEHTPDNTNILYRRAGLFQSTGNEEKAYQDYDRIFVLDPTEAQAWECVKRYLIKNGYLQELSQKYELLDDSENTYLYQRLELFVAMGEMEEATKIINRISDKNLQEFYQKQLEAYQYMMQGQQEKAEELLFTAELPWNEYDSIETVYMGSYSSDYQRSGKGILLTSDYTDTAIYIGEFNNGLREGKGIAFHAWKSDESDEEPYSNSAMLSGIWKNDLPNGECEYTTVYNRYKGNDIDYYSKKIMRCKYQSGYGIGEAVENSVGGDAEDQWSHMEKYMLEKGWPVSFEYKGKEIYSLILNKNGSVNWVNDDYLSSESYMWDVR